MAPFKKQIPIFQVDTNLKKATITFAVPVMASLTGFHVPCTPVSPKFKQYACAPSVCHQPHIGREDFPFGIMGSGQILTSTDTSTASSSSIAPPFSLN